MSELAEAFRFLQAGDAAAALEASRRAAAAQPSEGRARLAEGVALRMLGRHDEALAALHRAARLAPGDHACAYELGLVHQLEGRLEEALAQFARAQALRPGFFAAPFAAGLLRAQRGEWDEAVGCFRAVVAAQPRQREALLQLAAALARAGRHAEADDEYVKALASDPHHFPTLKRFGQHSAARGNFSRAATLFAEALRLEPGDDALPMFLAQVELLLGRWPQAWAAYALREPRRAFAHAMQAAGSRYRVPALEELRGKAVTVVAEQGLGDAVFFLRWAPRLREAGARLRFAGHPRLHSILARSGLFEGFDAAFDPQDRTRLPVLVGDLPTLGQDMDPLAVPSLRIDPDPAKLAQWRAALEAAGPRPWTGMTWRAGTPSSVVAHALYKAAPVDALAGALAGLPGTVVALQRGIAPGELAAASGALGAPVADFSAASEELEDALALVALLDRHVGVSNTNMHLAALAGATADVLEPFPPEWRWRTGGDSPWFPGFRVHRATIDGGWTPALASLQRAAFASSGRQ